MSNESVFEFNYVKNLMKFCTFSNRNFSVLILDMNSSYVIVDVNSSYVMSQIVIICIINVIPWLLKPKEFLLCLINVPPLPRPNFYLSSTISNQVSIRAMLKLLPELGLPIGCLPSGTLYNHLSTVLDFIIPFETRHHTVGARLFDFVKA